MLTVQASEHDLVRPVFGNMSGRGKWHNETVTLALSRESRDHEALRRLPHSV